jgi:hypothetical protein
MTWEVKHRRRVPPLIMITYIGYLLVFPTLCRAVGPCREGDPPWAVMVYGPLTRGGCGKTLVWKGTPEKEKNGKPRESLRTNHGPPEGPETTENKEKEEGLELFGDAEKPVALTLGGGELFASAFILLVPPCSSPRRMRGPQLRHSGRKHQNTY